MAENSETYGNNSPIQPSPLEAIAIRFGDVFTGSCELDCPDRKVPWCFEAVSTSINSHQTTSTKMMACDYYVQEQEKSAAKKILIHRDTNCDYCSREMKPMSLPKFMPLSKFHRIDVKPHTHPWINPPDREPIFPPDRFREPHLPNIPSGTPSQKCTITDHSEWTSKPPFSYITLIISAMSSKPSKKITLNEIYSWIMSTFSYYRKNTRRWQNSIRHALSFNDCFIKVPRPAGEAGKGSYWTVHPGAMDMFDHGSSMRRNHKFVDRTRIRFKRHKSERMMPMSYEARANSNGSPEQIAINPHAVQNIDPLQISPPINRYW